MHTDDLELLHALQISPRASWRVIGDVLHRSPAALSRRWDELTETGLAWCTAVPLGRGRQGTLIFVALLAEPGAHETLTEAAVRLPDVISIEEPATHWDLILSVIAPNIEEFLHRELPQIAALPGLARHETIICTRWHFGGHEWRLDALSPQAAAALERQNRYTRGDEQRIRPEDRALIPLLFADGRATVGEIAETLGAHPSTISRRMSRVLGDPSLSLRCDIAPEMVGQPISCQWFCRLPPDQHEAAVAVLRELPNLRFCATTTGQTNFTFVVWVASPGEIFELERWVVERIAQLQISESSVTIRFVKRMGWRLDAQGRRLGRPILPRFNV